MVWKNFLLRTRLAYEEAKAITHRALNADFPAARPEVAQLEDRVLLSASPVPVMVDGEAASASNGSIEPTEPSTSISGDPITDAAMGEQSATADASSDVRATEDTLGLLDLLDQYVASEMAGDQLALFASDSDADTAEFLSVRHELVLIDNRLPEFEHLIRELQAHTDASREFQIVVISGTDNGLGVLGNALAEHQDDLDAVHIFSHGTNGLILLGSTTLSQDTISLHSELFASWQTAVSEDADLLLYGCGVAATETGQAFVSQLAQLTGMDVAASIDATGHTALGGDWELEYATGQIDTPLAPSSSFRDQWLALLPTYEQFTTYTSDAALSSSNNWGQTFQHNSGAGQYSVNQISLALYRTSDAAAQNVTVTLRASWNGSVLATATVASSSLSTTYGWTDFNFGSIQLTDNQSYTIRATSSANDGKVFLGYAANGYANGTLIDNGGATVSGSDLAFKVNYINSAPVLDSTKSPTLSAQNEDCGVPSGAVGTLVSSLVDFASPSGQVDNVTDPDSGALLGIAITAADTTNGTWYFSTDGGTNWLALGAVNTNSARLLAADANTRLCFQPNANFNGTLANAITFRAWDRTSGTSGSQADTSSNGGTTAFSSATDTASLTINAVNDAPVLDSTKSPAMAAQVEDSGTPSGAVGTLISSLVDFEVPSGQMDNISDVDAGAQLGIAVTAADTANGSWHYSTNGGSTWNALGSVSNSSARLLAADANTRLYFQPNADYNGTLANAITFRAWDRTSGTSGSQADTSSNGGTTAFSSATDTASLTINAVNDAPVLDSTESPAMAAQLEDSGTPSGAVGTLISSLVDFEVPSGQMDNISDVDASAQLGIAVTAADTANGSWHYSTDGGSTWSALGSVSNSSARLLAADANTRVYFRPNANYNGTLASGLAFRAWDRTSGSNGGTGNPSSNGGTTAFSTATDTISATVNAVNDAPTRTNGVVNHMTVLENSGLTSLGLSSLTYGPGGGTDESGQTLVYRVTAVPSATLGNVVLADGVTVVTADTNYTLTELRGMQFQTAANVVGGPLAFQWTVQDNGGTANGGVDTLTETLNLTVTNFIVTNTNDSGTGSLRQQIIDSNNVAGVNTITFNLVGAGVQTIRPTSALPTITDAVVIDGYTQPGSSPNSLPVGSNATLLIVLSGSNISSNAHGLNITSGGTTVRGLVINDFTYSGIALNSGDGNIIAGNFIGTNAAGTAAVPNGRGTGWDGISIGNSSTSSNNVIGGNTPADRNVISGNAGAGIWMSASNGGNTIRGNYIGVNAAGTAAIGNSEHGILVAGAGNVVVDNIISGNGSAGYHALYVQSSAPNTLIQGNLIGVAADGSTSIGNTNNGIRLESSNNTVGGTLAAQGNTVANNSGTGVVVVSGYSGNAILGNLIYNNTGIGIDRADNGVSTNDGSKNTSYANSGMDFPLFTTASLAGNTLSVIGFVGSDTGQTTFAGARVEIFKSDGDSTGYGEGRVFLGFLTSDANGNFSGSLDVSGKGLNAGDRITGTASDGSNNTSEFGLSIMVDNAAPTLASCADLPTIDEDSESHLGILVSTLIAGQITDADPIALTGIAVTAVDNSNGAWQYSTNGGSNWSNFGSVSANSSRLLTNNASTSVRFVPNANWNGTLPNGITFCAWDQTEGAAGSTANTNANGGNTAFSTTTASASITVTAVNDAPVASGSATLAAIDEDATSPAGATVNALFGGNFSDATDQVVGGSTANTFAGIAISSYTVNASKGQWQYSTNGGVDWTTLSSTTTTTALTLNSTDLLRFVPTADYNGSATTLAANLVESGQVITSGATLNLTDATGGITRISSATVTLGETINPVNDAPVLDTAKTPVLTAQNEDSGAPVGAVGTLVTSLVDFASPTGQVDNVTEVDSGALLGIAITAADTANGSWYYSTNGGTNWNSLGAVANNNARLLVADANTRIYFQPNANYYGTLTAVITFRAWDRTSGSNGALTDTTTNGGISAFSFATDTANLTINPVADTPSVTNATTNEDTQTTSGLVISRNVADGAEVTYFKITGITNGTLYKNDGVTQITNGTFITFAEGNVGLKFTPTANFHGAGSFTVQASTSNGDAGLGGGAANATIAINPVADTPSVTNATTNEDMQTTNGLVISRSAADGTEVTHFKITGITNGTLFKNDGVTQITDGTFVMFAEGNAGLKFTPAANFQGTGSFTVQASTANGDGGLGGSTVNATITVNAVNDPSVLSAIEGSTLAYTENDPATAITATLTASDVDSANLSAATVQITANYENGRDVLSFSNTANIMGSWNAATGTLTLSGTDSVAAYQAALRAVKYQNTSDNPSGATRTVSFTVNDGTANSNTMTRGIAVTPVNDALVIISDGGGDSASLNIAENTTAVTTVTSTDEDGGAPVYSLAGGADAVKFTINSSTGVLSFLAAPNYESPTDVGGNNVYDVIVQVSDGAGGTDTQALAVTVTDINDNSPVITSNGGGAVASVNVAENTTAVTTVTATDLDLPSQILSYSIGGGADAAMFSIDSGSGTLSFLSGPNRESHTDADSNGVYEVTVQVSDGTLSDTQAVSITITDVDEFDTGPVTDANANANTVAEDAAIGTAVGLTGLASDADATNNAMTYTLDDNAGGLFAIHATTGVVTVNGVLDYETATSHSVTVRATSADGSYATQSFTISVTNVNEAGVTAISDTDAAADYVVENAANGTTVGLIAYADDPDATDTVSYALDDDANGRFAIHATTGVVTVNGAIDREAAGTYNITVRATSTDTSTTTRTFAITVGDVDEFDTSAVTDANTAANTVAENAAVGTVVGLTGLASDADATNNTITYTLDDDADGLFAIHATTGVVTVNGALDYETATSHSVTVRATSSGGSYSTQNFTISVTNVNEAGVTAISDTDAAADYVVENAANGTTVGLIAYADDPDATDTVSYALDDDANGLFAIDTNTGVVTVNGLLDYETATSHSVTVRATSSDGSSSTQSFTISVTNFNETPVSAVDQYFLDRGQTLTVGSNGVLGNDWDMDGDPLTVVLQSGVAHGLLILRADGTFTYQPNPTFFGIDQFTYLATDGALVTQTTTVTLVVNDSLPQPDTGNDWDTDDETDDSSTDDSSSNDEQDQDLSEGSTEGDATTTDTSDAGPDEAALAELTADVQAIIQRAFGGRTLEQQLEAAWADSEHDRNHSVAQVAAVSTLSRTRATLNGGMIATLRSEGLDFEANHHSLVLSTLPLTLESTSTPEEHVNQAPGISPESLVLGTSAAVSSALTVGYVTWLLRGGSLLASLLTSLPAWASFDPLPVLMSGAKQDNEDEDEDRLVDLVRGEETSRSVNSAAPAAGPGTRSVH